MSMIGSVLPWLTRGLAQPITFVRMILGKRRTVGSC